MWGFLRDFLRFLGIVLLGMKDRSRAFGEDVEMAENYVRWGRERQDVRDFHAALRHCEACRDDDAPKPDLLLRKYSAQFEAILGIMRTGVERFRDRHREAQEERNEMREEVESTRKSLQAAQALVAKLEKDGNMIKAKEELRHAEEIERSLARLQESVKINNPHAGLGAEFRVVNEEHMRYRTQLEMGFAALHQVEELAPVLRDQLIEGMQAQLQTVEVDLKALAPVSAGELAGPQAPLPTNEASASGAGTTPSENAPP